MITKIRKYLRYIAAIFIVIIVIAFASANLETVKIDYLFGESDVYVSVLVLISVLLGCLIGVFLRIPTIIKVRRENNKLKKKLNRALPAPQQSGLKSLPLHKQA